MSDAVGIDANARPVIWFGVIAAFAVVIASFVLSFSALLDVARWANVNTVHTWAVPIAIDGAIMVYTIAILVAVARGESAVGSSVSLGLWTIVSVLANTAHGWTDRTPQVEVVVGMLIAGLMPVAALMSIHQIARLMVARPSTTPPAAATPTPAPAATVVPTPPATLGVITTARPRAVAATTTDERITQHVPRPEPARTTPSTPRSPMTPELRDKIKTHRDTHPKASQRELAEQLGVSKSTLARTLAGAYDHLD